MEGNIGGMDALDLLIFAGFVVSLFLGMLLLLKQGRRRADSVLFGYLASNAFIFLSGFLYFQYGIAGPQLLVFFSAHFQIPLLILYLSLTVGRAVTGFQRLALALPAAYSFVAVCAVLFSYPEAELNEIFRFSFPSLPGALKISFFLELALPPVGITLMLRILARHRSALKERYSYLQGLELGWLKKVLLMELFVWFLLAAALFLPEAAMDENTMYRITLSLSAVIGMLLGFFALRDTGLFQFSPGKEPEAVRMRRTEGRETRRRGPGSAGKAVPDPRRLHGLGEGMERVLVGEGLFRDPELSLQRLAEALGVPAHHVSEVFSRLYGVKFYDYINALRVDDFKARLNRGEAVGKTLLALAYDSGFSSKATFNRCFKKHTGKTPSEYLRLVSSG